MVVNKVAVGGIVHCSSFAVLQKKEVKVFTVGLKDGSSVSPLPGITRAPHLAIHSFIYMLQMITLSQLQRSDLQHSPARYAHRHVYLNTVGNVRICNGCSYEICEVARALHWWRNVQDSTRGNSCDAGGVTDATPLYPHE